MDGIREVPHQHRTVTRLSPGRHALLERLLLRKKPPRTPFIPVPVHVRHLLTLTVRQRREQCVSTIVSAPAPDPRRRPRATQSRP